MKKLATILGATTMAVILSGCPIWIERSDVHWECGWDCADGCSLDSECPEGYFCEDGFCDATWYCDWDESCPAGYTCDDRDTCVPVRPVTCDEDADCEDGFCTAEDGEEGLCVTTGPCTIDDDCAAFGPGLACDERGICIPDEGPCPDGECGCTADTECDLGRLCINSRCTDPGFVCVFDFECASGALCMNNECHATCGEADCPVGQGCEAGICMTPPVGFDNCVYDEDCGVVGAFACINASCHPTCQDREECAEGEACSGGVCRADVRPIRSCTEGGGDCDGGMDCVRGICRMPCAAEINCADQGDMTVCHDDFCRFEVELDYTCIRASECNEGAACVNGGCVSMAE